MIEGSDLRPGQGQRRLPARLRPDHPAIAIGAAARPLPARRAARRRAGARPHNTVEFINDVQRWALHDTRLGIPVLFHEESLHGYMATDATMFPQAIALAGSFDTRADARGAGGDRPRGARARRAAGAVPGGRYRARSALGPDRGDLRRGSLSGRRNGRGRSRGAARAGQVRAARAGQGVRHAQAHDRAWPAGERQQRQPGARSAERELRENFFPPFREVVRRTGIGAVMPSYNEIDGVPSHGNRWLLGDVLRGEWGFDGVIVSDYGAVDELATLHHVAADLEAGRASALLAGVDSELPEGLAYCHAGRRRCGQARFRRRWWIRPARACCR